MVVKVKGSGGAEQGSSPGSAWCDVPAGGAGTAEGKILVRTVPMSAKDKALDSKPQPQDFTTSAQRVLFFYHFATEVLWLDQSSWRIYLSIYTLHWDLRATDSHL